MPVTIKTTEPKADVPFAQSPEFQKLQDAINQAKEALDDVSRQIVAVESKLNPQPSGKPGEDDIPTATDALGAPQPGTSPLPNPGPPDSSPGMRGRLGFEEAIEDMRRIAGLR
jgi:hypothetical protein